MRMQPEEFDVLIVGAGPAGTAAAYRAVDNNLNVLLLDKSKNPSGKPCAGGLTLKTLALMPYSVAPIIEHVTTGFDIGIANGDAANIRRFDQGSDICAFVVRSRFDAYNFEKTRARGAQFQAVTRIDGIEQFANHIELKADGKTIRAKYLVGADGANSQVRQMTMPENGFHRGFAIEGLIPFEALKSEPYAEFLLGFVQSGYGWIFPKADHANIGIYTNRSDVSLSKKILQNYAQARLGTRDLSHIKGYALGFGGEEYWQTKGRVLLVGDAGGYAEPLLGEGLHNAIKSGQAAGQAISDIEHGNTQATLNTHFRALSKPVRKDVKRCRDLAHQILYPRLNGFGGKALMNPMSRYVLLKGFAAGMTTRRITNRFMLAAMMRQQRLSSLDDFHQQHSKLS